ncbi:nuclear transport factor 2 family protein [Mycobacterium sp. CPCC 205372]|uniref:Nuclear transport factor 2 family protein n=1 Tax=Mycobacterium hippophais TaxID=3016340 RepID=A0ABT4PLC6_9MYCO|nr:nuclear transport factor 2 family protein [Mycobacterium hippophais]MCZ8377355.1 nuclear transport factor 2 family protein [Mycobacterium hippophais]
MTTHTDADAVRDVLARYALTLDVEDLDGCLRLFTSDAEYIVYGKTLTGERIRRMFIRAPKGLHLTGAAVVEVQDDTAHARSQILFVDVSTGQSRSAIYDDELVRNASNGWQIRRRQCQFLTPEGLSQTPYEG